MYLACTSQSPPNHMACTWLEPGFGWLCPAFLHSAFCILPSSRGGFEVAIGGLSVACQRALGWLHAAFIIHHSSSCIRLMVPGSALAPPKQCNSSKHVASMFLGCSLLVLSFPLLSFPRPTPNAPPPPPDYSLQTPEAWPRLQQPSIRFWHQKMPAANSSRFGLHPRTAPASTQPAATRLGQLLPQQNRQSDLRQVGLICRRRVPAPSTPDGAT